ncbi:WavE lipopolysaccharide synthesis family protein [Escherichia coli]
MVAQENTNRQIISTYQGLIKVRTPYAVKLRTDTPLRNDNIIKKYIKAQAYGRDYNFSYLEERILVSSINTIESKKLYSNSHTIFLIGSTLVKLTIY